MRIAKQLIEQQIAVMRKGWECEWEGVLNLQGILVKTWKPPNRAFLRLLSILAALRRRRLSIWKGWGSSRKLGRNSLIPFTFHSLTTSASSPDQPWTLLPVQIPLTREIWLLDWLWLRLLWVAYSANFSPIRVLLFFSLQYA